MSHVLTNTNRDNLVRSLECHGRKLGMEDWGTVWVQDGVVWLVDRTTATRKGDYFHYVELVRQGKTTFVPFKESAS